MLRTSIKLNEFVARLDHVLVSNCQNFGLQVAQNLPWPATSSSILIPKFWRQTNSDSLVCVDIHASKVILVCLMQNDQTKNIVSGRHFDACVMKTVLNWKRQHSSDSSVFHVACRTGVNFLVRTGC